MHPGRGSLRFFACGLLLSLFGLLITGAGFAATLEKPISGIWSGGANKLQITGTLEGGFEFRAAETWMLLGCPINAGTVLSRYTPKGGSSYDVQWLNLWATTTQGQEGVKCEYLFDGGPKRVTVTRSAAGALNLPCIGVGCSYGSSLKLVMEKPTKPQPPKSPTTKKDTSPPVVKAFSPKGFAVPGGKVELPFSVKDDSGRARVHNTVYEGGRKIGQGALSPWWTATGQRRSWTGSTVNANNIGPLRFCLQAADVAGNLSKRSCAWIPLLVPIEKVSNTCGGEGNAAFVAVQRYFGNKHTYATSNSNPLALEYEVDFSDACNLHDAGYGGYAVEDKINGGIVDYRDWSRPRIDRKFLADMRKLCAQRMPNAKIALANCQDRGGSATIGARHLYEVVAKIGWRFFDADLTTPGIQKRGHRDNFDRSS